MTNVTKGSSVRLNSLIKHFGDVVAVDRVSLDIKAGEFITLLGPSGSGKTTTLMMIAGFEIPDEGEIFIDDEPVMFKPSYKRGIGMVFQHYSLFPHMTVERNIEFPLMMRRVDRRERRKRIGQALELIKLTGHEKRFPKQLSGGQQQRVALARALVFNPRVLLMDEPLGALDKKLREHMQLEIKQITRSLNITVMYVTHDQSEAMTMSDRIAVMNSGRIEQVGSPTEIYEKPINYFVADFIGESNFIEGRVEKQGDNTWGLVTEDGIIFKTLLNQAGTMEGPRHLLVRPEKISVIESGQSFANQWEAVIKEAIYHGDITIYMVDLGAAGMEWMVKQQNKFATRRYEKGDKVWIGWNEKDGCIL